MSFSGLMSFPPRAEAPELHVDDITLRGHVMADFAPFWAFCETTDRAAYVGKPKNPTHLWYALGSEIASWPLRGMGAWAVDVDGAFAGQIAITQPPHFPEVEISWTLFEGRGIAQRAASEVLNWFWGATDHASLVSYIDPRNARSIALAERLGATHDPAAQAYDAEDLVYRHRRPT